MDMIDLRTCRSLLFLPAANERAIAKARELPADLIILDLEDSVREEEKDEARRLAIEARKKSLSDPMPVPDREEERVYA